jgi:hypothetical protein
MKSNILESEGIVQTLVDAIPSPLFLMDYSQRIQGSTKEASRFIGSSPKRAQDLYAIWDAEIADTGDRIV